MMSVSAVPEGWQHTQLLRCPKEELVHVILLLDWYACCCLSVLISCKAKVTDWIVLFFLSEVLNRVILGVGISLVSIVLVCHADAPPCNSLKAFSVHFAVFRKHLVMLKCMNNLTAFLVMCFKFHPHKRPVSHIVSAVIKGVILVFMSVRQHRYSKLHLIWGSHDDGENEKKKWLGFLLFIEHEFGILFRNMPSRPTGNFGQLTQQIHQKHSKSCSSVSRLRADFWNRGPEWGNGSCGDGDVTFIFAHAY